MPFLSDPQLWLDALDASSDRLDRVTRGLSADALTRPSFAQGWSIGQVLSHLGSAAEICTTLVERGQKGDGTGPVRDELLPVWERWDSMSATEQRETWRAVDTRHRAVLRSLDPGERKTMKVPYFSGPLGMTEYVGYRLSEQSVHAWDVEVALNPRASLPANEVRLLWERLDLVATRFHDAETLSRLAPAQYVLRLSDLPGGLELDLGSELHIHRSEATEPAAAVSGSAEAVLRLVYGRNRSQDGVGTTGALTLEDLTALFPGY